MNDEIGPHDVSPDLTKGLTDGELDPLSIKLDELIEQAKCLSERRYLTNEDVAELNVAVKELEEQLTRSPQDQQDAFRCAISEQGEDPINQLLELGKQKSNQTGDAGNPQYTYDYSVKFFGTARIAMLDLNESLRAFQNNVFPTFKPTDNNLKAEILNETSTEAADFLKDLKATDGVDALVTVMTAVNDKLDTLGTTNQNLAQQDLLTKDEAKELLGTLKLHGEQLKAFSQLLTHQQGQYAKDVWQYLAGKPTPHPALAKIVHDLAESFREINPELEQPEKPAASLIPESETNPLSTLDLHTRLVDGIPITHHDQKEALSEKLFTAGATLTAFEKAMADKGLDLNSLQSRLTHLQQKLSSAEDIYPNLKTELKSSADALKDNSQLKTIIDGNSKELQDFFLLGRKGVEGAAGLGRLEGSDSHKALVVLAQRLNEKDILTNLEKSQNKKTALAMEDFGKYEDLCADLCKLGLGATGGGGIFGHKVDEDKVKALITELKPFTAIANAIAKDKPLTFTPEEQQLQNTLQAAGLDISKPEQLSALQSNLKEYKEYKEAITTLPGNLSNRISVLRSSRDGAKTALEGLLEQDDYRSFLEKVTASEMIRGELTVDKTKPEFETYSVNESEVKLNPNATKRLVDAFDRFAKEGHLTTDSDSQKLSDAKEIHLWEMNAFLPKIHNKPGQEVPKALVGDSIADNNSKFVSVLGATLPLAPDATTDLKPFYDALKQHETVLTSQKKYEKDALTAYDNYFKNAEKLLGEGFMGQLNSQLNNGATEVMALVKLQRAS